MSCGVIWKQVTTYDKKLQKDVLIGFMKIKVETCYIPLSSLTVDRILKENEKNSKKL